MNLLSFDSPYFEILVHCSRGFYIRKLVDDIGKSLDSCAVTCLLERTKQSVFSVEDIPTVNQLKDFDYFIKQVEKGNKKLGFQF